MPPRESPESLEQLKRHALSRLRKGDFALASCLLERGDASAEELVENLRIYQAELEAQAAELHESKARLEAALGRSERLFDALPLPVVLTDVFGLVRSANDAAKRELGMGSPHLGHTPLYRWLASPDDRARVQGAFMIAGREGRSVAHAVGVAIAADRSATCDLYIEHLPAHFAPDPQEQFIVTVVDQTARLAALAELRSTHDALLQQQRENARLAEVARLTGQAVVITDAQRRIVWVNAAFSRITGYGRDEVIGRTPGRLLQGPDTDAATLRDMAAALAQGRPIEHVEVLNYAKDGRPYWLLLDVRPVRDANGTLVQYVAVQTDITERKRSEQILRESEARQRAILEAEPNGIVLLQRDGLIRRINPAGKRMLGEDDDADLSGRALTEWVAEADRAALSALNAGILRGSSGDLRIKLGGCAAQVRPVHVTSAPLLSNGEIDNVLVIIRDISGEVEAERLRVEKDVAERASRTKTEFLSHMSHELRTPLNAVLGFAQLLDATLEQTSRDVQHERLHHILTAGRQLLSMIDDILDLSRIESNHMAIDCHRLDLVQTVRAAVDLLRPLADRGGIALAMRCERPVCEAWADPLRVTQILNNLVSNAIKYNRPAGSVDVRLAAGPDWCSIEVADTGPGLNEQQRAHLFEPFNRLGAERTAIAGTGIGLVISRRLVELMGGRIEVGTSEAGGASFRVLLRTTGAASIEETAVRDRAAASATPALRKLAGVSPRRVLYVEDDDVNVAVMQAIFDSHLGWPLTLARDGAAGLRHIVQDPPDLILLDMHLPDMSGLELYRRLRGLASTASVPCILITADALAETRQAALDAGVADVLLKPIDLSLLLGALERIVPRG